MAARNAGSVTFAAAATSSRVTCPSASSVSVSIPSTPVPVVLLGEVAQESEQPRGPADAHQQQPGGHGVERSRVADLPDAQRAADPGNGVVRGDAGRLVDQQHAVRAGVIPRAGAKRGHDRLDRPRHVPVGRVPGGQAVSPAPVGRRDGADVGRPTGSQAHLEQPVLLLLHHAGHVGLGRRADHVDQVVGLGEARAGPGEVLLRDERPHEPATRVGHQLDALERGRQHAEEGERAVLVERLRELRVVEPGTRGGRPRRAASRRSPPGTGTARCRSRCRRTGRPPRRPRATRPSGGSAGRRPRPTTRRGRRSR